MEEKEKIISLIERNSVDELEAYFSDVSHERPLDYHEEMVLLEHFSAVAVKSYINRFKFSVPAEAMFVKKATRELCQTYINYYGLHQDTQKYVIDNNLVEVAQDYMLMRRFWDDDYLLDHGSGDIIRNYIMLNSFETDDQVMKLLNHKSKSLFHSYVTKGRYISERVKTEVVKTKNAHAFTAIMLRFNKKYNSVCAKTTDWQRLMKENLADCYLPEHLQVEVLESFDRYMTEVLLRNTPLLPSAQKLLFKYNFDAEWLKVHATCLYGKGGYRFGEAEEIALFKALAVKEYDVCLTETRLTDDTDFICFGSSKAVRLYVQKFWLSDDAQIALLMRKQPSLAKEFISRFTPEHGMCWQAEVKLVKLHNADVIRSYISFHTMCYEALQELKETKPELYEYYFTLHEY